MGAAIPASSVVTTALQGDVLVVTIDNPPVNALGAAVRQGLLAAMQQAQADAAVASVAAALGAGAGLLAGQEPNANRRLPVVAENGRAAKPLHLLAHVEQRPQCGDVPILCALRCGPLHRGAVAHEVRGQVVKDDVAC